MVCGDACGTYMCPCSRGAMDFKMKMVPMLVRIEVSAGYADSHYRIPPRRILPRPRSINVVDDGWSETCIANLSAPVFLDFVRRRGSNTVGIHRNRSESLEKHYH